MTNILPLQDPRVHKVAVNIQIKAIPIFLNKTKKLLKIYVLAIIKFNNLLIRQITRLIKITRLKCFLIKKKLLKLIQI